MGEAFGNQAAIPGDSPVNTGNRLISVIIVNYNGGALLPECLDAVLRQSYAPTEIIVVDNGSTDTSHEVLLHYQGRVRTILLGRNSGFTGGNIEGLRHATGEWIVLLNNDAILCDGWLETMVNAMETDASIGTCAARVVIAGTRLLDAAGDVFTTAFSGTKVGELRDMDAYAERRFVPGACAAAVIYRRNMLDDIGFLDDDFFLNHEDTDLHMRAWLAGWKCLYVPEAIASHKVSTTIGRLSDVSVYYFARNSLWVWVKNTPTYFLFRYFHHRVLYEISSMLYYCFVAKKWRPFLRGKVHSFAGMGKMLNKRRAIQQKIRLSRAQIKSELIPITRYLKERLASLPAD